MKFSSQPAVQFNGLWKTIEQWLEGRKDFLLHTFAKPNIQLLPLLSLPISSQSCRSFVCTVYFHFSRAEIMHKLCNHSHVYLWPFLNGVRAACTTSYSTEYLYIAQNSLFFPLSDKSLVSFPPIPPAISSIQRHKVCYGTDHYINLNTKEML